MVPNASNAQITLVDKTKIPSVLETNARSSKFKMLTELAKTAQMIPDQTSCKETVLRSLDIPPVLTVKFTLKSWTCVKTAQTSLDQEVTTALPTNALTTRDWWATELAVLSNAKNLRSSAVTELHVRNASHTPDPKKTVQDVAKMTAPRVSSNMTVLAKSTEKYMPTWKQLRVTMEWKWDLKRKKKLQLPQW